jgi:hypothetical protein
VCAHLCWAEVHEFPSTFLSPTAIDKARQHVQRMLPDEKVLFKRISVTKFTILTVQMGAVTSACSSQGQTTAALF